MQLSKAFLMLGLAASALTLAGCNRNPLLVKRSQCPAVAIPAFVGSVTQFDPPQSRNADAIALVAPPGLLYGHVLRPWLIAAFATGALDKDLVRMLTRRRGKAAGTQE